MNYYEEDNKPNYAESSTNGKNPQNRERGGIIPVTSTILKEAEVTKDETVTYQGIQISDITIVGYIIDYKELESRIKMTLFDYTGTIEVNFFNKMNNQEDTIGLNKFYYDGSKKPVQIYGTVKVYKNEKNIQGAKIMTVPCSNILYHRIDVIHSWLYLNGKLNELKDHQVQNSAEEAKMIAMGNNNNGYGYNNMKNTPVKNSGDRDIKEAVSLLSNYAKKWNKNDISYPQINNLFKKFGNKQKDIINKLIINNKLIDTDEGYEILD